MTVVPSSRLAEAKAGATRPVFRPTPTSRTARAEGFRSLWTLRFHTRSQIFMRCGGRPPALRLRFGRSSFETLIAFRSLRSPLLTHADRRLSFVWLRSATEPSHDRREGRLRWVWTRSDLEVVFPHTGNSPKGRDPRKHEDPHFENCASGQVVKSGFPHARETRTASCPYPEAAPGCGKGASAVPQPRPAPKQKARRFRRA